MQINSNKKLLFYDGYEEYFKMVEQNKVFSNYCNQVFGIDFSQEGFSDIKQTEDLINMSKIKNCDTVLDIGCGNGRMSEYISDKTGALVYGFDYSKNAIAHASNRTKENKKLIFDVGVIDEKKYPNNFFNAVLSVDTMYFTSNMPLLIQHILDWMKPAGIFVAYYSEGHLKEKSADKDSTELALALKHLQIPYHVIDYTKAHFDLMKHKRRVVLDMKNEFENNGMKWYYEAAINQSIDLDLPFDDFTKKYNRYLYIVIK